MLYQYAPWQEKDKENFTRKNIEASVLYFNTPDSFNDPFDNAPSYNINSESRNTLLNIFIQDNSSNFSDSFINEAHNISASAFNNIFKHSDYNKLHNSKRGITCFSRDNTNILMWSHYANKHSGVCLGFDIDESDEHLVKFFNEQKNQRLFPNGNACRLLPIKYVSFDERPLIDMTDERKSWAEILTSKSNLWEYEQEVRIMVLSNNQMIFPRTLYYQANCLKEIICGANMKLKTFIRLKNFIEKLPNANNISISIMTLSESAYKMIIRKLDLESLQMISKNYYSLCSPDEIFSNSDINELRETYGIGERRIKKYWNKSLDNILIHRIVSDFQFDKIKIAEIIKQSGDALSSIYSMRELTISLFLDSMTNDIKYLAAKDI